MAYVPESTRLVIFPAHNENDDAPYDCRARNPELGLADWKGFLNLLINEGIDKLRLCYNDEFLHSTPLAGYAGACLIYSYLFKEPAEDPNSSSIAIAEQMQEHGIDIKQIVSELANIREKAYNYLYN